MNTTTLLGRPLLRFAKHQPICEFIESNMYLSSKFSSKPGPINLAYTPYVRPIYEAFTHSNTEKMTLLQASQTGKSTTLLGIMLYSACNMGVPSMWVLPERKSRDMFMSDRIRPTIELSKRFSQELMPGARSITNTGVRFASAPLYAALADSESDLASRSIGLLLCDEIDKFPAKTTREGSPLDQAEARTRTFPRAKILYSSTPTHTNGPIAVNWRSSDQREWMVACPSCGERTQWRTEDIGISDKPDGMDQEQFIRLLDGGEYDAWWECPSCNHKVSAEAERRRMNKGGEFVAQKPGGRHVGFRVPALASPFITFREYACKYLDAKRAKDELADPEKMKMFRIHQEALPYEEEAKRTECESIVDRAGLLPSGVFPHWTSRIVAFIDVQQSGLFWAICGFGNIGAYTAMHVGLWGRTDQAIQDNTAEINALVRKRFSLDSKGQIQLPINCAFIDSGDGNTISDVYRWTNSFPTNAPIFPTKGVQTQNTWLRASKGKEHNDKLLLLNTTAIKNVWQNLMNRDNQEHPAPVSFATEAADDLDFQRQMVAEEKVVENGKEVWRIRHGYSHNHWYDCVVGCIAAAAHVGVFSRGKPRRKTPGLRRAT